MRELTAALDEFVKNRMPKGVLPAVVTAVDEVELTCDVQDMDGNELFDVRLRAALDGEDTGLVLLPKVGSNVLIKNIANQPNAWAVTMWSEIDKVVIKTTPVEMRVDAEGLLLKNGSESLAGLVGDLIAAIKLLTVTCAAPGLPSSVPLNAASFTALETRFNDLLKSS